MRIIDIEKSNLEDFDEVLGSDLTAELGRHSFRAFAAVEDDDTTCGVMVYELTNTDSGDGIESDIVCFNYDSKDAGTMLWDAYEKSVQKDAIASTRYETEEPALADFFASIGFSKNTVESRKISFTVGDLSTLPIKSDIRLSDNIISNRDVSVLQYRNAVKNFLAKGITGSAYDLEYLPLGWFERDISACSLDDNKVNGMFLIRRTPSKELRPVLYGAFGQESQKALAEMLAFTARKTIELYPPETVITIKRHNPQTLALCNKILAGRKGTSVFSGEKDHVN